MKTILTFILFFCIGSAYEVEHFLMPKDGKMAERSLIQSIDEAKSTIDIAMFMITNKKLTHALIKRASKGHIRIRVIADYTMNNSFSKSSKAKHLLSKKNIMLYTIRGLPKQETKKKKEQYGIMHSKLMIVDNKTVYAGSANWTYSAFSYNYELLIKIVDSTTAKLYSYYFEDMFRFAIPYTLESR